MFKKGETYTMVVRDVLRARTITRVEGSGEQGRVWYVDERGRHIVVGYLTMYNWTRKATLAGSDA